MNHISERAFKEWLTTEGVAVPIHTGITGDEIEGEEQRISCYCESSDHKGGPLYTARMAIVLVTPPHSDGAGDSADTALSNHRTVLATLRGLVEDYDESSLATVYLSETNYRFAGAFLEGEEEQIADNGSWLTRLNFLFGIDTDG